MMCGCILFGIAIVLFTFQNVPSSRHLATTISTEVRASVIDTQEEGAINDSSIDDKEKTKLKIQASNIENETPFPS